MSANGQMSDMREALAEVIVSAFVEQGVIPEDMSYEEIADFAVHTLLPLLAQVKATARAEALEEAATTVRALGSERCEAGDACGAVGCRGEMAEWEIAFLHECEGDAT